MQIQYLGFEVAATARTYNFRVTEGLGAARDFTVKILLAEFRNTALRFQDGPEVCCARLHRALAEETPTAPAKARLRVEEQDSAEFFRRRYPRKRR